MYLKTTVKLSTIAILVSGLLACGQQTPAETTTNVTTTNELNELFEGSTLFTNARVWDGRSDSYLENAVIVVRQGRVLSVFSADDDPLPEDRLPEDIEQVDLGGHYVIPGLINAHGHVGMADGLQTGESIYSEDLVRKQLATYAHYGITSVVSLGDEPEEAFQVRDEMNEVRPGMSRLWVAGDVLDPTTEDEAVEQVERAVATNPDWVKIRVDSQLGRQEVMPEPAYAQVIESSHANQLPLASHMVTLEDSKGLMRAGSDLLAHSVRDAEVDDELIELMLEREVCITPTLTRELSTYIYADHPAFFNDPFFLQAADAEVVEELQQDEVKAQFQGRDADYYRNALPLAMDNMMRLFDAGVGVAMGTDSGPPARFIGYFEHMEMQLMEGAGMQPVDVLRSATIVAAQCMGLDDDLGELSAGFWADFLVLSEDPMEGVDNLRSIEAVYISGEAFASPFNYTHR